MLATSYVGLILVPRAYMGKSLVPVLYLKHYPETEWQSVQALARYSLKQYFEQLAGLKQYFEKMEPLIQIQK